MLEKGLIDVENPDEPPFFVSSLLEASLCILFSCLRFVPLSIPLAQLKDIYHEDFPDYGSEYIQDTFELFIIYMKRIEVCRGCVQAKMVEI